MSNLSDRQTEGRRVLLDERDFGSEPPNVVGTLDGNVSRNIGGINFAADPTTPIEVGDFLLIDGEKMYVDQVRSAADLSVLRGVLDTEPGRHTAGTDIAIFDAGGGRSITPNTWVSPDGSDNVFNLGKLSAAEYDKRLYMEYSWFGASGGARLFGDFNTRVGHFVESQGGLSSSTNINDSFADVMPRPAKSDLTETDMATLHMVHSVVTAAEAQEGVGREGDSLLIVSLSGQSGDYLDLFQVYIYLE